MEDKEIITQQDPQMQMFAQLMEGTFEETGALLLHSPSDVGWRGLHDRRGSVQTFTVESSHTSGLSGQWHDCLFQNRRKDTLQAERHTSYA